MSSNSEEYVEDRYVTIGRHRRNSATEKCAVGDWNVRKWRTGMGEGRLTAGKCESEYQKGK